jgi:hypothetical protein
LVSSQGKYLSGSCTIKKFQKYFSCWALLYNYVKT